MASYAPLFANADAWQWTPDLIWVDGLRVLRTPSYYVQMLFSRNRGSRVLPVSLAGAEAGTRLYACASLDEATGEVIVKVVNGTGQATGGTLDLSGGARVASARMTLLQSGQPGDENTFEAPDRVIPKTQELSAASGKLEVDLPAYSFGVIRASFSK